MTGLSGSAIKLAAGMAVALVVFILASASTTASDNGPGLTVLAQTQKIQEKAQAQRPMAPTKLTAPGKGSRKDCNGQSAEECCKGLDYCGCLWPPLGGKTPTACFAGEPPKGK